MVDIIDRIGTLKVPNIANDPYMIVLHDTVTPTVSSAENGLKSRGLGYHFIIDKDGTIYQYAPTSRQMWHALGWNKDTIGISFVCGGQYGVVSDDQMDACVDLINDHLIAQCPNLTDITCHKNVSKAGKTDPRWDGQPENDWSTKIDKPIMTELADAVGLIYFDNNHFR